ncbi:MAG: class I SAM-dependent methyltransferase [Planctomycetes bacterium]|nr:class I SAM-dependent methyltransferase [Planctomycetota bacterium]MCB9868280.1 class I SAM-dependent methyltransferase [Planctomycetota bacterium]
MISTSLRGIHEANRASWNAAVIAHNSHKGDQIRFFRGGGSTLFAEERDLLGGLDGLRLLHLQCNCGQDSLSLAQLGAAVTGVDIADQAIDFARNLAVRTGIPAEFHRADVYDWLTEHQRPTEGFDVVFSSYGAIRYLSSLGLWARLVRGVLAPGGKLVLVEFHPFLEMFDDAGNLCNPYSEPGQPRFCPHGVADYVGRAGPELAAGDFHEGIRGFANPYPHHTFHWGLGEITDAVLAAGMRIEVLREYPYANGRRHLSSARTIEGRRVLPPPGLPTLPMMFGMRAIR